MANLTLKTSRGCGSERKENALYVCCGLSPYGRPFNDFIEDPVVEWEFGWQRGSKVLPRGDTGIYDLYIFVGKEFYPSLWDFIVEGRNFGVSRHIINTTPFHLLTPGKSFMRFIHANAIPDFKANLSDTYPNINFQSCKHKYNFVMPEDNYELLAPAYHLNDNPQTFCTYAMRELGGLMFHPERDVNKETEIFTVNLPCGQYYNGYETGVDYTEKKMKPGIFLSLPITHFEVKNKIDPKVVEKVNKAGYELEVMEY